MDATAYLGLLEKRDEAGEALRRLEERLWALWRTSLDDTARAEVARLLRERGRTGPPWAPNLRPG